MSAGELPLSISEPGKLPRERFKDAGDVEAEANMMIAADQKLNAWRSQVEKLWGGNPTYSLEALKASAQGWRSRTNYRGLEGLVSTIGMSIYNLDVEVPKAIEIELDYSQGEERADICKKIEEAFTWLMFKKWDGFDVHILTRILNMVLHGIGTHVWNFSSSWIPRTTRAGTVLFPDDCPVNFEEEGEFFMVRDFWPQNYLYEKIEDEAKAREMGWNPDVVWKAMAESTKRITPTQVYDPTVIQRLHKQGDMGYSSSRMSGLFLNFFYVKEFESGKWSLYLIEEKKGANGYLFKRRNLFDDPPVSIFPYDLGNGTLQSIRGIGQKTKEFFEMTNRLNNAAADALLFAATMPMKQTGDLDPDKLKLLKLGVLSILPQGIEPIQGIQFQNVSQGLVALGSELKNTIAENNQSYMAQQPEAKDRQTYLEYAMRSQDANKINKGSVNLYDRNRSRFFDTILKMVCKPQTGNSKAAQLGRAFMERLKRMQVPMEALKHIEEVTAVKSIGAGSAAAQLQAQLMLMQYIYGQTTDDRKINIEQDLTASLVGYNKVDRYARSQDDNNSVTADESFATVETDALVQGGDAKVGERQDHVKHLQIHLGKAEQINQAYLDGQYDPQQAFNAIIALGNHSSDHLKVLESLPSRKAEFKFLYHKWQALSNDAVRIQNELEANNNPPPEQKLSEEAQLKSQKIQLEAQLKDKKLMLENQRKIQELNFNNALSDASEAAKIRRANRG